MPRSERTRDSHRSAFTDETLEALLSSPDIRLVTEDVPAAVIAWLAQAPPPAVALSGQTVDCETTCREYALMAWGCETGGVSWRPSGASPLLDGGFSRRL